MQVHIMCKYIQIIAKQAITKSLPKHPSTTHRHYLPITHPSQATLGASICPSFPPKGWFQMAHIWIHIETSTASPEHQNTTVKGFVGFAFEIKQLHVLNRQWLSTVGTHDTTWTYMIYIDTRCNRMFMTGYFHLSSKVFHHMQVLLHEAVCHV